tara:strand:+ start:202 stop:1380 length:1179 start_codon:yes stop_codon:yes gene_type:complete
MNNFAFKELVNKNVLIPSDISKKIINFINLNNENYLDTKISKYLTYNKLIQIQKNFQKYKQKINMNKLNKNRNFMIYKYISEKYKNSSLILDNLNQNRSNKINGYLPSLSSLLLYSTKIKKYFEIDTPDFISDEFKKLFKLCKFQTPNDEILSSLIVRIIKAKKSRKELIFFTPACPDYSKISYKNFYKYTFNDLGAEIGLVAERLLEDIEKIENFMNKNKVKFKHIVSIGDFEAFSQTNLKRLNISEKEFINRISISQKNLNIKFKKFKFNKSILFTEYFGGKGTWLKTKEKFRKEILKENYGNSGLTNEKLDDILKSRIKLYRKWYGEMSKEYYKKILIDQGAEYAAMGQLIDQKFNNAVVLGADHHRMADFYRIDSDIPVVYLKKKYIT